MKKTIITLALALATTPVLADATQKEMTDHSQMDHSQMEQNKMDHSSMNMAGMSEVGMPAKGTKPDKVVQVLLSDDMTITFKNDVDIALNDVVQFVVMNTGSMNHEFSIGSVVEQSQHREMMSKNDSGKMEHNNGSTVMVEPGKAKQLQWHFHGKTEVEFACNLPGHAEAGMVKQMTLTSEK